MTPIFGVNKRLYVNAGQTSDGVQFTNAPWTQVNTASKPLFTGKNTVDGEVLYDLLSYVNSTTVWNGVTENNTTPISGSAYTALTCEDFGKLDSDTSRNFAQLLVTLYKDTIVNSSSNAVQWQVVYRSIGDEKDVLTLYMNDVYKTSSEFDTGGENYLTGYYTNTSGCSILRDFVSTSSSSLQSLIESAYGTNYLVAPKDIPSRWQSVANQPDSDGSSITIHNGLGEVEDRLWVPSMYEVAAMDNQSSYISNVSDDKSVNATLKNGYKDIDTSVTNGRTGLWKMNGYDRAMGNYKSAWLRTGASPYDNLGGARVVTSDGATSAYSVGGNYGVRVALHLSLDSLAEEQLCKVLASSSVSSGTAPTYEYGTKNLQTTLPAYNYCNYVISNNTTKKGSATATFTEVNSTKIKSFILKTATSGKTIYVDSVSGNDTVSGIGNYSYTYSGGKLAVTVSNLSASTEIVASDEAMPITNLILNATNNAGNSLLVLTIMDGGTRVAEYNCISGTISVNLPLEQKKTYKILATRPFGSRLNVLLDGATLAPNNFACYEITTGTKSSMNLSFTLSGDGSWKNCVIV